MTTSSRRTRSSAVTERSRRETLRYSGWSGQSLHIKGRQRARPYCWRQPICIVVHHSSEKLSNFQPVTVEEIIRLLAKAPTKHCQLDPIPTWLLKQIAVLLAAVTTTGKLPSVEKHAIVSARSKKPTLDTDDLNSYRPISNLSFMSKLAERYVASGFVAHCEHNNLFLFRQSADRHHHSTQTTTLIVHSQRYRSSSRQRAAHGTRSSRPQQAQLCVWHRRPWLFTVHSIVVTNVSNVIYNFERNGLSKVIYSEKVINLFQR